MKYTKFYILITLVILLVWTTLVFATNLSDAGNNILRDTDNNLEWINHTFTRRNWTAQTAAVAALTYNGISDWRLPTKTELLTLVSSTYSPQIDPLFNLGSIANWTCWSSTAVTDRSLLRRWRDKERAYLVFFGNGRALDAPKKTHKAALYVRTFTASGWKWNNGDYITWNDDTQIDLN